MAKLSHKISTNNSNNNERSNNKKLGFSLSTKVDNNENTVKKEATNEASIESLNNLIKTPISLSEFIEKIGLSNFGKFTKTDFNSIFPAEVEVKQDEVTKKILNKLLNNEFLIQIEKHSQAINQQHAELFNKYSELNKKNKKQDISIKNLSSQIDDAEELAFKIQKKYEEVVPVVDLIEEFLRGKIKNDFTKRISTLLLETYKNSKKKGAEFIFSFSKGFVWIEDAIASLGENEKENLDILYQSGTKLLFSISELSVPERRPILDIIANLFNNYLHTYDFISPEQTLQIDPLLHNAEGLGGNVVKEGESFAVVRRETRKTVYYADIKTR